MLFEKTQFNSNSIYQFKKNFLKIYEVTLSTNKLLFSCFLFSSLHSPYRSYICFSSVFLSIWRSDWLSATLSVCLTVCLCLSICVFASPSVSVCLTIYLSLCLTICLSVCLTIYLSVCPSVCMCVPLPVVHKLINQFSSALPVCLLCCPDSFD